MSTRDDTPSQSIPPPHDTPTRPRTDGDRATVTDQDREPGRHTDTTPGREHSKGDKDNSRSGATGMAVKTSVAAAFALALGVAALLLVLTVVLSPIGALFGIIGLILGIVGIRAARKPARTGKGVAITGLVFSIIALLLVAAAAIGLTTFFSDPSAVNQVQQQIQQLTGQAPKPSS